MLHDAAGLGVKPSPSKATNKAENILAAEHVVSNFRRTWQKNVLKLTTKYD